MSARRSGSRELELFKQGMEGDTPARPCTCPSGSAAIPGLGAAWSRPTRVHVGVPAGRAKNTPRTLQGAARAKSKGPCAGPSDSAQPRGRRRSAKDGLSRSVAGAAPAGAPLQAQTPGGGSSGQQPPGKFAGTHQRQLATPLACPCQRNLKPLRGGLRHLSHGGARH